MAKKLIVGAIAHYNFRMVEPFLSTLRKSGYDGDVVFFCSDISSVTARKLASRGVRLVHFQSEFPYTRDAALTKYNDRWPARNYEVTVLRFLLAYAFLKAHEGEYEYVMLTDVRDVIFQKDPFDFPIGDSLCCFSESEQIIHSPINVAWITEGFGGKTVEQIGRNTIVCSGTIIGSTARVLEFLDIFLDTAAQHFKTLPEGKKNSGGIDQGFFNYLVRTGAMPFSRVFQNDDGPVLTLGYKTSVDFDSKTKTVRNAKGAIPNVVHQYDRHLGIAGYYWSRGMLYQHRFKIWRNKFSPSFSARAPWLYYALKAVRDFLLNTRAKLFRKNV